MLANGIQWCILHIIHYNQVLFILEMQGWFNIREVYHLNEENHMMQKSHLIHFSGSRSVLQMTY